MNVQVEGLVDDLACAVASGRCILWAVRRAVTQRPYDSAVRDPQIHRYPQVARYYPQVERSLETSLLGRPQVPSSSIQISTSGTLK